MKLATGRLRYQNVGTVFLILNPVVHITSTIPEHTKEKYQEVKNVRHSNERLSNFTSGCTGVNTRVNGLLLLVSIIFLPKSVIVWLYSINYPQIITWCQIQLKLWRKWILSTWAPSAKTTRIVIRIKALNYAKLQKLQ